MYATVCDEFGPIDQLSYREISDPQLKPGHVVVNVHAVGVNFPDGLLVQGLYQMKPERPFVPGSEISGVVTEVADDVSNVKVGQRVIGLCMLGGYAQKVVLPATHVIDLPDQINFDEGAGLVTAHATAHHALKQRAKLKHQEVLLVTGAAGGTGLAAVQIGKVMGAKVIAVCSTEEKCQVALANGADEAINTSITDVKESVKAITDGKGVDVVYECVGGDLFHTCSRVLAWNGRLLVIGFAGGEIPKFPVNLALVKGYSIVGVFWGSFTQHEPLKFYENMHEMMRWYLEGKISVNVDKKFDLKDAKDALLYVNSRQVKGKVIIQT